MRRLPVFAILICFAAISSSASAQGVPPPSSPSPGFPPSTPIKPTVRKAFMISQRQIPGKIIVAGKTSVYVEVPKDVKESSVTVQVADHTFSSKSKPYKVEIDFSGVPDGEQPVTAVAQDESGTEVWKGSTVVTVDNAGKLVVSVPGPGPIGSATPPTPSQGRAGAHNSTPPGVPGGPPAMTPPAEGNRTGNVPGPARPDRPRKSQNRNATTGELAPLPPVLAPSQGTEASRPGTGQPLPPGSSEAASGPMSDKPPVSVTQVFESKKFGVKIQYPAGWKTADHTVKLKPKEPGGFWFSFTSPDTPPKMIINFKHRLLKKPTTPDNYAKYNTYLLQWTRTSANGKPCFETTQGAEEAGRIVHRKMVIDGRHIWMFNCIDQTSGPEFESKALLEQVVNSAIK